MLRRLCHLQTTPARWFAIVSPPDCATLPTQPLKTWGILEVPHYSIGLYHRTTTPSLKQQVSVAPAVRAMVSAQVPAIRQRRGRRQPAPEICVSSREGLRELSPLREAKAQWVDIHPT